MQLAIVIPTMEFLLVPRRAKQEVVWPWHFGDNVFCGICSLSRSFASPQSPAVRLSRHDQQPPQLAASSVDGCVDDQDYNDGAQNDHPIGKLNAGYRCLFAKPFHDYPAIFKQRLAKGEAPTERFGAQYCSSKLFLPAMAILFLTRGDNETTGTFACCTSTR